MNEFVLHGAEVVVGDGLRFTHGAPIHVRDGKVLSVGVAAPADVPSIDLSGRLVLPGFVNAHTHIADAAVKEVAFSAPPGTNLFFPPDGLRYTALASIDTQTRLAAIRSAARQMLSSGVVAFADFTAGGAAGVRELRHAVDGLAIRALSYGGFTGAPQAVENLDANTGGLEPRTVADVIETLHVADGFAPVRTNDLTDQAIDELRALADSHGKPLATHAAATPSYSEISLRRNGMTDIARAATRLRPSFLVHLTAATDDDVRTVAEHGIPVVMCPRANVSLGAGAPPFFAAKVHGATVGLGTDNLMLGSPDILAEVNFLALMLRSIAGNPAVVDERALLHAATLGGARAIGIGDTHGSIAPGKSASFVIFDRRRDNLAYSTDPIASLIQRATVADISAVMVDGDVVHGSL